jgi:predicted acetyltransferase
MTEQFRFARADEVPDIARLVRHSFIGRTQAEFEENLRDGPLGGLETVWVGEAGGRLSSACLLLRFMQWVGGSRLPLMGLGLVAVSPAHRRQRVAGRLVTSGMRQARERGDLATALYPFRIRFYEDLGYGLAGEAHQYMLPPEQFPDAPERRQVSLVLDDADFADVRRVYERWASTETGQLERHAGHWQRVLEGERAGAVFRNQAGEAEGYAIVRYRSDLPSAQRFLEVEERAWLTPAARRGIYAWIASLSDQWRLVAYRAHPDEGFADVVREPRLPSDGAPPPWGLWFPAATLMGGPMFRLLDVPAAWAVRRVSPAAALTLRIQVQDAQIPENDGSWRLRLENGGVEVERSDSGGVDVTLRLSVRVLSRIFIGALAPSAAVEAGQAEADRAELLPALDDALRLRRPWTFDRF